MKNILVTGASRGLGLEITKILLSNDYSVYAISRTVSPDIEKLLRDYPNRLFYYSADLTDTKLLKETVFKDFITFKTKIDGFVSNAAIAYDDIITNANLESIENMYHVNVFSPIMITKNIIRNMLLHQTKGSIVHLSSISVHTGYKGLAMYASTKGALEAFSKNTAREWGEKGIRSNCVVAGFMETDMSNNLNVEQKLRIYQRTALKEATDAHSVAQAVRFLLSDESKSITGQNIFVDSGTI